MLTATNLSVASIAPCTYPYPTRAQSPWARLVSSLSLSLLTRSPFDDEARRRRGDTNTSSSADLPSAKNFHLYPTIDITFYFRPPLAYTGIVQIYTHDRRKGSTMDTEGEKAGYGDTMVGRSKRTRLEGALHFYEVDKKGRSIPRLPDTS